MHEDNGRKQELPKTPSDLGKPPNSQEPAAPQKETPQVKPPDMQPTPSIKLPQQKFPPQEPKLGPTSPKV